MKKESQILDSFAWGVVKHRKAIIAIFVIAAIVCVPLLMTVKINFNLADYLAESARSTQAIRIMSDEFDQALPNTEVLIRDVSIPEALAYKEELSQVPNVSEVIWLDDMVNVKQPLITLDQTTVETYYRDGNALFMLSIKTGAEKDAIPLIRAVVGEHGAVAGDAASNVAMQEAAFREVMGAFAIVLPAILLILIITTTAWFEPLLFLAAIGFAVILNMGTNVIFGEISFMTNSVSPILQLAVSLDYTIFLLHAFARHRKVQASAELAMKEAVKESFSSIAASAATTLFGFLALLAMQFLIGADLGINLAKGIIFSFISVMVFLPGLTLVCLKLLDKTAHRPFTSSFAGAGKFFLRISPVVAIAAVLVVTPAFLGQQKTEFLYGKDSIAVNSAVGRASVEIEEIFGKNTTLVSLVPRGDTGREVELAGRLADVSHVTSITSYTTTVGAAIPPRFLSDDIVGQFYSDNYARIILNTNNPSEGDRAFNTVQEVIDISEEFYGEEAFVAGQAATLLDMRNTVSSDTLFVNLLAIAAIFLVLLVSLRSLTLPFLLVFAIECAIWINLAIPFIIDQPINFIGYLVLSSIQLGATVDYAILLTTTYTRVRQEMPAKEAMLQALGTSFKSILVSAVTMAICGIALAFTTTNPAVADIGVLLSRGTILSATMVLCFLPAMLLMLDKLIAKTTYKSNFYYAKEKEV